MNTKQKIMRKIIFTLFLSILFCTGCHSSNDGNESETKTDSTSLFVSIQGQNLIQADGSKLFVQGVNLGNWLLPEGYMFGFTKVSPHEIDTMLRQLIGDDSTNTFWSKYRENYVTLADLWFIRKQGCNTVRLPLSYKLFTDDAYLGLTDKQSGYQIVDKMIQWCRETGLYLILDMHAAPGGQTGENIDDSDGYPYLYENEEYQQKLCSVWQEIADRYKNEPIILGYELLNEPIGDNFKKLYDKLEPVYIRVAKAIREVDKNHLLLLDGASYGSNFNMFSNFTFDNKMIYACHDYTGKSSTLDSYVAFREKAGKPMLMTEYGHADWSYLTALAKRYRDNNIGYLSWPYKMLDTGSSFVAFEAPNNWDKMVNFQKTPRNNQQEIKEAKKLCSSEVTQKALNELLDAIKLENCVTYQEYINTLGM